jgi:hypothetical protein
MTFATCSRHVWTAAKATLCASAGEPTLREALGCPPRCRARERLAVAENRAIDAILELPKQESRRAAIALFSEDPLAWKA